MIILKNRRFQPRFKRWGFLYTPQSREGWDLHHPYLRIKPLWQRISGFSVSHQKNKPRYLQPNAGFSGKISLQKQNIV